jgi:MFS family permease
MRSEIDYAGVHPENKWTILKDQWRFALWAFFTSMGSVMFGFDLGVGQQVLAMAIYHTRVLANR